MWRTGDLSHSIFMMSGFCGDVNYRPCFCRARNVINKNFNIWYEVLMLVTYIIWRLLYSRMRCRVFEQMCKDVSETTVVYVVRVDNELQVMRKEYVLVLSAILTFCSLSYYRSFQTESSTRCRIVFPLSFYSIITFPYDHPVTAYVLFFVTPSLLSLLLRFLQESVLEGSFYARCNEQSS